jgi:hypothetical protein
VRRFAADAASIPVAEVSRVCRVRWTLLVRLAGPAHARCQCDRAEERASGQDDLEDIPVWHSSLLVGGLLLDVVEGKTAILGVFLYHFDGYCARPDPVRFHCASISLCLPSAWALISSHGRGWNCCPHDTGGSVIHRFAAAHEQSCRAVIIRNDRFSRRVIKRREIRSRVAPLSLWITEPGRGTGAMPKRSD